MIVPQTLNNVKSFFQQYPQLTNLSQNCRKNRQFCDIIFRTMDFK